MPQFLDQCLTREVRSSGMQVTQLGPRENHAVTIDDKISCRYSILSFARFSEARRWSTPPVAALFCCAISAIRAVWSATFFSCVSDTLFGACVSIELGAADPRACYTKEACRAQASSLANAEIEDCILPRAPVKQFVCAIPVPEFWSHPENADRRLRFTSFRGCDFRCPQRRKSENAPFSRSRYLDHTRYRRTGSRQEGKGT